MARKSKSARRPRQAAARRYPRTARLNTLLQQIVADFFKTVDDERLGFVTVTGVEVDSDLNRAQVFISTMDDEQSDDATLEVLEEYRKSVQAAVGRSARLRKTPTVVFGFDPGVRAGARIEEILASLNEGEIESPEPPETQNG